MQNIIISLRLANFVVFMGWMSHWSTLGLSHWSMLGLSSFHWTSMLLLVAHIALVVTVEVLADQQRAAGAKPVVRDWVLENAASDEHHEPLWHWFGMGRSVVTACGKYPIPGTPLAYATMPKPDDLDCGTVCPICKDKREARQREHKEGT